MNYHIRAERLGDHFDTEVGAKSLPEARERFERAHDDLGPFDWRGAVVFCRGEKPAEEINAPVVKAGYKLLRGRAA